MPCSLTVLPFAQRKQFGASSEKYAEGYEQMNLFNEAEANADAETEELLKRSAIPLINVKKKRKEGRRSFQFWDRCDQDL